MENFYRVDEVAEIFKVKPITIRKWCKSGLITAKKFGKSWYIFKDSLKDLITPIDYELKNKDSYIEDNKSVRLEPK